MLGEGGSRENLAWTDLTDPMSIQSGLAPWHFQVTLHPIPQSHQMTLIPGALARCFWHAPRWGWVIWMATISGDPIFLRVYNIRRNLSHWGLTGTNRCVTIWFQTWHPIKFWGWDSVLTNTVNKVLRLFFQPISYLAELTGAKLSPHLEYLVKSEWDQRANALNKTLVIFVCVIHTYRHCCVSA